MNLPGNTVSDLRGQRQVSKAALISPRSLPPPPSPIARATESHTPTHREVKDESDRVQSLPDFFERSKLKTGPNLTEKQESNNEILTIGDVANLLTETESSDTQPPCLLELPFVCRLSDTPPFTQNSPATLGRSAPLAAHSSPSSPEQRRTSSASTCSSCATSP